MSNMLQACSILYKTKLPMLLVRLRGRGTQRRAPAAMPQLLGWQQCVAGSQARRVQPRPQLLMQKRLPVPVRTGIHDTWLRARAQVFNKCDVTRHAFALEWMADFEAYHAALEQDTTYAATLSRSLSLVRGRWRGAPRSRPRMPRSSQRAVRPGCRRLQRAHSLPARCCGLRSCCCELCLGPRAVA